MCNTTPPPPHPLARPKSLDCVETRRISKWVKHEAPPSLWAGRVQGEIDGGRRQQASTRPSRGVRLTHVRSAKVSNEAAWITLRRRRFISGASRLSFFCNLPALPRLGSCATQLFYFCRLAHTVGARHFDRDQVIMTPEDVTFFSLTVPRSFLWVMRGGVMHRHPSPNAR